MIHDVTGGYARAATDLALGLTRQQQFTLTGNGVPPHAAYLALDRLGLRDLVVV